MNPVVKIDEPIEVIVSFLKSGVQPVKFRHNGQIINVCSVNMRHPIRRGRELVYIFYVSDGQNDYSLEFNTQTLSWRLLAMIDGGQL